MVLQIYLWSCFHAALSPCETCAHVYVIHRVPRFQNKLQMFPLCRGREKGGNFLLARVEGERAGWSGASPRSSPQALSWRLSSTNTQAQCPNKLMTVLIQEDLAPLELVRYRILKPHGLIKAQALSPEHWPAVENREISGCNVTPRQVRRLIFINYCKSE